MRANRYVIPALVLLAGIALVACSQPTPPPPTPALVAPVVASPTVGATAAPPTAAVAADDWARIKAAGKMVVGTSLDNPPFSYYNRDHKPDGFDIALMTDLARRLGVQVEFEDFAFEGLLSAVQLKQVDAAIAAITNTPERAGMVDFTNTYYVGQGAALAAANSPITSISSVNDIAKWKTGVQRGSVYETWLKDSVVATGQMPASNLLSYAKPAHAVRDVVLGLADLAILDLQPAELAVKTEKVKLVGKGVNPQNYGITIPRGSTLLPQLNQALGQAQADGTTARLIQQYLDLSPDQTIPIPTPPAQPTPVPTAVPPACLDGAAYVADLNLDDQNMTAPPPMKPNQPFSKGWRVRNSGTCDWTPNYTLAYAYGNVPDAQMGGQPVAVGRTVKPGETVDLWVNLSAPSTPGVYQGVWNMVNAAGIPFGQKVNVAIDVQGPPTPTPAPTQTPAPGVQFSADPTQITAGQCTRFTWNVQNIQAVYFYAQGENYLDHGVAGQGSAQECPPSSTVYELRVVHTDGSVEIRQIQITVLPSPDVPVIAKFTSNPEHEVTTGKCVQFTWVVEGPANRVALVRDNAPLWDYAPVSATYQDCPKDPGEYRYELQAFGPGGIAKKSRTIDVVSAEAPPTPKPTPAPTVIVFPSPPPVETIVP